MKRNEGTWDKRFYLQGGRFVRDRWIEKIQWMLRGIGRNFQSTQKCTEQKAAG